MRWIRSDGAGRLLGGAAWVGLALLATLDGILIGWLPGAALPAIWLGGNAAILLGAHTLAKPAKPPRHAATRSSRANGRRARG